MVTDENGRTHCNCKYCGGKPKVFHGVLTDFIQCDDCQTSFSNWEEYDSIMDNFQERVVRVSDIAKNTDINNWAHPYGISFKRLNEIDPVEISTEVVKNAYWLPVKDTIFATCSECGFQVENHRAVEMGETSDDYVKVKYHRCPICEARMHIRKKGN